VGVVQWLHFSTSANVGRADVCHAGIDSLQSALQCHPQGIYHVSLAFYNTCCSHGRIDFSCKSHETLKRYGSRPGSVQTWGWHGVK